MELLNEAISDVILQYKLDIVKNFLHIFSLNKRIDKLLTLFYVFNKENPFLFVI